MALPIFQRTIVDDEGNILTSASVSVKIAGTSNDATLYSTDAGGSLSNPFNVDTNAVATFYADPGLYDITATDGSLSITWSNHAMTGDAALFNSGTGADELPKNSDLGEGAFVGVGTGAAEVPTNGDLGSASLVDVGTGEAEVPTNGDLGSASLVDTGTGADQVPTNGDLGAAAYINTGTDDLEIPTNGDLGAASKLDTGTLSGQIPTNDDLGDAAYINTGTNPDQIPKNFDLGSASLVDVGTGSDEVPRNSDLGSASLLNTGTASGEVPTINDLGSAALLDSGTGLDQLPTNADLGSASLVDTGAASNQVPTNSDLGSASLVDTGTDPLEVPTNADLGTAAYVDTGTDPDQIPKNFDLGTAAFADTGTGLDQVPTNNLLGAAAFVNTGTDSEDVPTNGDLGTASVLDAVDDENDTTPDRLLKVGATSAQLDLSDIDSSLSSLDGRVSTNESDISTAQGDISALDSRVTENESDILEIQEDIENLEFDVVEDAVIDIDFTANKAVINGGFGVDKVEMTAISAVTHTRSTDATGVAANLSLGTASSNIPRLVYDSETGEALGYQAEESRTNLILQSEDFSGYTLSNANTPTDSGIESPIVSNWWLVESTSSDGAAQNNSGSGLSADGYNCFSGYLKKDGSDTVELVAVVLGGTTAITVELNYTFSTDTIIVQSDETGTAIAGRISQNDGSVRLWIAFQNNDTGNLLGRIYVKPSETQADTVYATGLQIEQGKFPTSYTPTTTSTILRDEDGMSLPVGDNLNQNSFSLYWEGSFPNGFFTGSGTSTCIFGLTDDTYSNGFVISARNDSSKIRTQVRSGLSTLISSDVIQSAEGSYKMLLTWDSENDSVKFFSGGEKLDEYTGIVKGNLDFSVLDMMYIAKAWEGNLIGQIFTKKVKLYNKAPSDSDAIRITL